MTGITDSNINRFHGDLLTDLHQIASGSAHVILAAPTYPPDHPPISEWVDINWGLNFRQYCDAWVDECRRILVDGGVLYASVSGKPAQIAPDDEVQIDEEVRSDTNGAVVLLTRRRLRAIIKKHSECGDLIVAVRCDIQVAGELASELQRDFISLNDDGMPTNDGIIPMSNMVQLHWDDVLGLGEGGGA